jgi:diaminopimelate decarboxylase
MAYTEKNGTLHCENVALTDIAQQYGTPTYVYSAASITSQYQALEDALKNAIPADRMPMLCYACKANSNVAILRHLKNLGSGLEIVSEGELIRGLKAGFDPKHIVSTGVGKQVSEIKALLTNGVHQLNVESIPELIQIGEIAAELNIEANVVFRLNPDVSGGGHSKISTGRKRDKFGLGADTIMHAFDLARDMSHVNALGMSVHIGSQVFDVSAFKQAFEKLPALVNELRSAGHTVSRLDIGGGFPIVYKDENLLDLQEYANWVRDIIVPLDTEIIMEPGRYLVGNAGVLLTEVLHIKETQDRNFLIIDAAMNDLIRPTLYEAYHGVEPVQNRDAQTKTYDIVGPICETGDTFSQDRELPTMAMGDLAVIKSAGAYGFCMASNYNTRPMPPEILIDGDNIAEIRPRQSYDDIIGNETIPDWL